MAVEHDRSRTAGLRTVEARLHMHRRAEALRAVARSAGRGPAPAARFDAPPAAPAYGHSRIGRMLWGQSRWMRWFGISVVAATTIFVLVAGGLWLLLASGPISFDIATPWLAAAVAEKFGNQFGLDIRGHGLARGHE